MAKDLIVQSVCDLKDVTLVGNIELDPEGWAATVDKLNQRGWNVKIIDPNHSSGEFHGQSVYSHPWDITDDVPVLHLMDTSEKSRWLGLCSQRMETRGDVQVIWLNEGTAVTQQDREDFLAFGWDLLENTTVMSSKFE